MGNACALPVFDITDAEPSLAKACCPPELTFTRAPLLLSRRSHAAVRHIRVPTSFSFGVCLTVTYTARYDSRSALPVIYIRIRLSTVFTHALHQQEQSPHVTFTIATSPSRILHVASNQLLSFSPFLFLCYNSRKLNRRLMRDAFACHDLCVYNFTFTSRVCDLCLFDLRWRWGGSRVMFWLHHEDEIEDDDQKACPASLFISEFSTDFRTEVLLTGLNLMSR